MRICDNKIQALIRRTQERAASNQKLFIMPDRKPRRQAIIIPFESLWYWTSLLF